MEDVGSRERFVAAAGSLLREKGFEATRVREVAAVAAASMGSFYFHFPGGKEELAAEAMRAGGREFATFLSKSLDGAGPLADRVAGLATRLAADLERSEWRRGCPVAATALETLGRSETLQAASDDIVASWERLVEEHLRSEGLTPVNASRLASNVIAILEGAELMARIRNDSRPLHLAGDALRSLTSEAKP
jgi:TetR/AcrR family transcriptional repressor of lmrAB and yxaGH operons